MAAAAYLANNIPVLPMGGFTSDAPAPTVQGLAALVRTGKVRYVVVTGLRVGGRSVVAKDRDAWVAGHCRSVPALVTTSLPRSLSAGARSATTRSAAPTGVFDCS